MMISIERIDKQIIAIVNGTELPVKDYKIISSADGTTELEITIEGKANEFELSANL